MKWGLKGGISIYSDSGPPRYVLWCCGSICQKLLTFIQIGCGHTVSMFLSMICEIQLILNTEVKNSITQLTLLLLLSWFSQTKMCICFLPPACYSHNNRKKSTYLFYSKLFIPSTLNTDYLLWTTQLIVCAVKY